MKKLIITSLFCVFAGTMYAQDDYGIKEPKANEYELDIRCGRMATIFRNQSKEIAFGVREDDQHNLYFQFNNKEWFQNLFKDSKDGIAVDVITKGQFDCKMDILPDDIRGEIIKPVFKNHLLEKVEKVQEGF